MAKWHKSLLKSPAAQSMAGTLLAAYGALCLATSRKIYITPHRIPSTPALITLWHGRLAGAPLVLSRTLPTTALVSAHQDGQLVAHAGRFWGVHMVAGSTTKVGPGQIRTLLRALRTGHVFLTPDGPRGPRQQAHTGTAQLATLAKVPLIPTAISIRRAKVLRSWDKALLPTPFTTYTIAIGEPLHTCTDATLTATLNALQEQADIATGRLPKPALRS